MPRNKETTHLLIIGKWSVEALNGTHKVKLMGTSQGFTLQQKSQTKWKVSGVSLIGSSRLQIRKVFAAKDLEEALDHGGRLVLGLVPESKSDYHPHLTIAKVLHEAIMQRSHGQKEQKAKLCCYARYFIEFCEGRKLRLWEELKHSHVDEYVEYLRKDSLRRKTLHNYIHIIGFGMRHVVADFPEHYRDFWMSYNLPAHIGEDGIYDDDDGSEALSVSEVLKFYEWLKNHRWAEFLRPGVLLGGLVGLRVREIVYLSWQNVLFNEGCIVVQNEEGHIMKNKYSVRKVPVPKIVLEALGEIKQTPGRVLKVETNKTFNWDRKKTFLEALSFYYGVCLNKAIKEWRPKTSITARGLRRTLQTVALESTDWPVHLVDRYVGHAPKTVMERHYFGDKKSKLVESFRDLLLPKIESKIAAVYGIDSEPNSTILHFSPKSVESLSAQIIDMTDVVG